MWINKYFKYIFVALLIAISLLLSSYLDNVNKQTIADYKFVVYIDVGHGGIDKGASSGGVKESDVNLKIANNLKEQLAVLGVDSTLSRDGDYGLYNDTSKGFKLRDMMARKKQIDELKPSLVISLHQNTSTDKNRRGFVAYYSMENNLSKELAQSLALCLDRMPKLARATQVKKEIFFITTATNIPSVILECGFLTNEEDLRLMQDEEYTKMMSLHISSGILNFLSQK